MEVDPDLVFSCEEFEDTLVSSQSLFNRDSGILDNADDPMAAPHPSPAVLAQFSEAAYKNTKIIEKYIFSHLPIDWKLLTTARNDNTLNGYFGAAFWSPSLQQVVLAHRGTVPTNCGALRTNLTGVVFKNYSSRMNSAATFADKVRCAINKANERPGSEWRLSITGHSLGGWLAQVTGLSVKHLETERGKFQPRTEDRHNVLHAHVVVFDSPGCKRMLEEIVDSFWGRHGEKVSLESMDISSYLSAPNRINTFGLHIGSIYRVMVDVPKLWCLCIKYTLVTHSIDKLTKALLEGKQIYEMEDWPLSKIRDVFNVIGRTEYTSFHQEVSNENQYHLTATERDEVKIEKHYKNTNCNNSGNLRMFSEDEVKLLHFWITYKKKSIKTTTIQRFLDDHKLGNCDILFEDFSITDRTIICDSKETLEKVITRCKLLMRWFSKELIAAVDKHRKEAPKIIYSTANEIYLHSLPDCPYDFIDSIGLRNFLESERQLWRVVSEDCDLEIVRLSSIVRQLREPSSPLDTYVEQGCHTFLCWADVQHLKKTVDIEYLPDNFTNDNLLIINCDSTDIPRDLEQEDVLRFINHKKFIIVSKSPINQISDIQSFTANQLTKKSQLELFKKKMFGFGDNTFSVEDIVGALNFNNFSSEINKLINSTDLKEILKNNEYLIKIKNSCPNSIEFCGNISAIDRQVSVESLAKGVSSGDLLVGSGSRLGEVRAEFAEYIPGAEHGVFWVSDKESDRENQIKQNILTKPNNRLFWIHADISSTTVTVKQIYHKTFYMERQFHRAMFIVADWNKVQDIFIFQGVRSKESLVNLLQLSETMRDIFLKSENIFTAASDTEVNNIIKNINKKPVHVLQIENGEKFLWQRSLGSLENLRPCVRRDPDHAVREVELHCLKKKAVIIADEPGMGKSTSLASMARQLQSNTANWVIWIQLKHFKIPNYEDMPREPRERCWFLLKKYLTGDSFPHGLLQFCVHHEHPGQVYFMFDGFDEIAQPISSNIDVKKEVLKLLVYLNNETTAMIWVTTRRHETESLENALSVIATTFEEINVRQQQEYLCNFWSTHLLLEPGSCGDAKLKKCAQYLLTKATKDLGGDIQRFMGVPLQMRMLAEVFLEQANDYVTSDTELENTFEVENVFSLYKKFTDKKFEIFYKLKTGLSDNLNQYNITTINDKNLRTHRNLSFFTLFPEFAEKYCEPIDGNSEGEELCRIGLVQTDSDGYSNIEFLHRTLAEYFAADQIVHFLHMRCTPSGWAPIVKILLTDVFLQDSYKVIRIFVNNFLLQRPTPDYARGRLAKEIGKLWDETGNLLFNNRNVTAFHVAVWEMNEEIVDLLFSGLESASVNNGFISFVAARGWVQNDTAFSFIFNILRINQNESSLHKFCQNIFEKLKECLRTLPPNIILDLLYAIHTTSDEIYLDDDLEEALLQSSTHTQSVINRIEDIEQKILPLFFAAVEKGRRQDVEVLYENLQNNFERNYVLLAKNYHDDSVLHISTSHNKIDIIKMLCNRYIPGIEKSYNSAGLTPLHCAAAAGHLDVVAHLLTRGLRVDCKAKLNGATALRVAIENGHLPVLEYLVEKGGNINSVDDDDRTALHFAAESGHLPVLMYLVEKGGDINSVDEDGHTALHLAAENGHLPVLEYLVEKGGDINSVDEDGHTALHLAVENGHLPVLEYLVEKGGDINSVDEYGHTALQLAAENGHLSVLEYLVEKGGDINSVDEDGYTALHFASKNGCLQALKYLVKKGGDINSLDSRDHTALHIAAKNGHLPVLEYLVEKGGDINSVDKYDHTALYLAAKNGHFSVLEYLMEKGGDINSKDCCCNTALHLVAKNGHVPLLEYIVEKGGDINSVDEDGHTALHLAAENGHQPVLEYLVEKGGDINSVDEDGYTALHLAAENGHLPVLKYLVEKGGDINSVDEDGHTALHIAAENGHLSVLEYLVKKGGDINSVDEGGHTALHLVAKNGHLPILEYIVEKGLDINSVDENYYTALHLAADNGHLPVLKYLVEKGGDINSLNNHGETALQIANNPSVVRYLRRSQYRLANH